MKPQSIFSKGFTLVELLIAIFVVAILIAIGVPSYKMLFDSDRLQGASSSLYFMLNLAKSESRKNNSDIFIKITTGPNWCVGTNAVDAACDCNIKGSCDAAVSHNEYENLTLQANYSAPFYGRVRGAFNEPTKFFKLQSESGNAVQLNINMLGTVRMCGVGGVLGLANC